MRPAPCANTPAYLTTCRRLSRSVSARCQASGTNTERPADATSSPASSTWMRASPSLPTKTFGSAKTIVQSLRASRFVNSAVRSCSCGGVQPELVAHYPPRDVQRRIAREVRARRTFGQPVPHLPDLAIADHGDAPFLGPFHDVAVEAGKAHVPHRRRKRVAGESAISVRTRLAPDKALREALSQLSAAGADVGEVSPSRAEHNAPFAKRRDGCGFGARAIDSQRRHIRREWRARYPRRAVRPRPAQATRAAARRRARRPFPREFARRRGAPRRPMAAMRRSTTRRAVRSMRRTARAGCR